MKVIMQTNDNWTTEDGIWAERLSDGGQSCLWIYKDNPATYMWDDDNGYVFIKWFGNAYKVQSIDLDWLPLSEEELMND